VLCAWRGCSRRVATGRLPPGFNKPTLKRTRNSLSVPVERRRSRDARFSVAPRVRARRGRGTRGNVATATRNKWERLGKVTRRRCRPRSRPVSTDPPSRNYFFATTAKTPTSPPTPDSHGSHACSSSQTLLRCRAVVPLPALLPPAASPSAKRIAAAQSGFTRGGFKYSQQRPIYIC